MKRIISLILATLMTVNLLSLSVLAAEDTSDTNTTQYSAVFQFDEPDNEAEMHSVTVIDECVYADLNWLAQKLELKLEINNSGNYLPERNGSSVNPIIRNMIDGYESSFKDAAQEEEYVISKPDVNLLFYLRSGSSTVYSYSEYMGNISADLGGSVQHIPDRNNADADVVWVPMSMFLSIFDSFCWIDGTTIHILPCSLTAVDVLHTPNLDQFFYDPVTNGGIDEWVSNTKRGYAIFYNKVKKLFQGVVSFNPVQVWESLSLSDYSDVSNTLALQLCTPNASELDMLKRVVAETGSTILRDYSTYKSVSDLNSDKSSLDFTSNGIDAIFSILGEISDTVEEGTTIRAVDMFEKLSGNNWDLAFENADEVAAAVKDAVDAGSVADTVTKWANGIDFAGDAFSLAAPIFISYITSAHEISSSLQEYNSAVQNYISEFNVSSDVFMKEEIIDTLDEKSKMYMSQSTSVFDDELAKELKKTTLWSGVSFAGGKIIDNFVDSLWQYKVISLGWDIGEWVANGLSGGAFDSLQALNNSSAALMLEYDSQQVVRQFKDKCKNTEFTNDLLEQYKSLELVRLKSYLITREDVLSYYKFWEKKKPEEYPYAEAEITKDNEAILRYMAALLSVKSGITNTQTALYEKESHTMDNCIIHSDTLCDNPLKAYAESLGCHYNENFSISMLPMGEGHEWYETDYSEMPIGPFGYSIKDFDSDGMDELLVFSAVTNNATYNSDIIEYSVSLSIYEIVNGEVTLSAEQSLCGYIPNARFANDSDFDAFVDCYCYGKDSLHFAVETADFASLFADGRGLSFSSYKYTGTEIVLEGSSGAGGSDGFYDKGSIESFHEMGIRIKWKDYFYQDDYVRNHVPNYECLAYIEFTPTIDYDEAWKWQENSAEKLHYADSHIYSQAELEEKTGNVDYIESPPLEPEMIAYCKTLEDFAFNNLLPNGVSIADATGGLYSMAENSFAVYDVDGDGSKELLLSFVSTFTGAQTMFIFKYDYKTGKVVEQFSEYPYFIFYGTDYIWVGASHNHSPSSFWPFTLYKYDEKTDSYSPVGTVSACDKDIEYGSYTFPSSADKDGNGRVYYISGNENPVDDAEYENWWNSHIGKRKEVEFDWLYMWDDDIYSLLD